MWDYIAGPTAAFSVTTILPPMVLGRNMQALSAPRDLNQSSLIVSPGNYTCDEIKITTLFHIIAWKYGNNANAPAAPSEPIYPSLMPAAIMH